MGLAGSWPIDSLYKAEGHDNIAGVIVTDTLTGDSTDIFAGPVDLEKGVWEPEWFSVSSYIVNTEKLKDHHLDRAPPERGKVTFTRHDIKY